MCHSTLQVKPIMDKLKIKFISLFCCFEIIFGAKILLLPPDHPGHINIFCIVGKALIKRGHEVHMIGLERYRMKIIKSKIKPLLHKPVKAIGIHDDPDLLANLDMIFEDKTASFDLLTFMKNLTQRIMDQTEEILRNSEINKVVKETKFNLAIIEGGTPARAVYLLAYKYGIPYITLTSSVHDPWGARIPAMPSVEPMQLFSFSNEMSFCQRLANFLGMTAAYNVLSLIGYQWNNVVPKYAPEKAYVTLDELYTRSEMFINNIDVLLMDYPRVSAPHYIYITGTGGEPPNPLANDLNKFVSSAKHGIILVSFGSFVKKFPRYIAEKLFDVCSNVSHMKYVVRYSGEVGVPIPPNVKLMNWLPQNDLLGHPQTKLFLTHGGTNGMMESIYHGVPLVVTPLGGDHPYNARKVEIRHYGRQINIKTDTAAHIAEVVRDVLNNVTYHKSIKRAKQILNHLPKGNDTIVFWVEHILKFGSDHIRPSYIDMPMYKYFMLDVLAFLSLVTFGTCWIIFKLFNLCVRKCCKQHYKEKSE